MSVRRRILCGPLWSRSPAHGSVSLRTPVTSGASLSKSRGKVSTSALGCRGRRVGARPCGSPLSLVVRDFVPPAALLGGRRRADRSLVEPGLNRFANVTYRHLHG